MTENLTNTTGFDNGSAAQFIFDQIKGEGSQDIAMLIDRMQPPISFKLPANINEVDYDITDINKIEVVPAQKIYGGTDNAYGDSWYTEDKSSRSNPQFFQGIANGFLKENGYGNLIDSPISVVCVDGNYFVSKDGRHRLAVLKALGVKQLPVLVTKNFSSKYKRFVVLCEILTRYDSDYVNRFLSESELNSYKKLLDRYRVSGINLIANFINSLITSLAKNSDKVDQELVMRICSNLFVEYKNYNYSFAHPFMQEWFPKVNLEDIKNQEWDKIAKDIFAQIPL